MMGLVGRLGKVLGPKGLMPNPKVGTVTADVVKAVRELKAGRVEFRVEKAGVVHARIGKASFGGQKLLDNARVMVETLMKLKPASAKGTYMKSVTLSTTIGSGSRSTPTSGGRVWRAVSQETLVCSTEKNTCIASLKSRLARAHSLVLADFRGLTFDSDNRLRREFARARVRVPGGQEYPARQGSRGHAHGGPRAAPSWSDRDSILLGGSRGSGQGSDQGRQEREQVVIKGGYVDGRLLDQKGVEALSTLPRVRMRRARPSWPPSWPRPRASCGCSARAAKFRIFASRTRERAQERRREVDDE